MKTIKVCDACSTVYGIDSGSWRDTCGSARFSNEGNVFKCSGSLDTWNLTVSPGAITLQLEDKR